jgi:hypothetical protein
VSEHLLFNRPGFTAHRLTAIAVRRALMGSGDFGFHTKASGRGGKFALEGTVKRRLGLVADFSSDLRDAVTGGHEQLRTQLQPPTCANV